MTEAARKKYFHGALLAAVLALTFVLAASSAVFARPTDSSKLSVVKAADGTTFKVFTRGDEFGHWTVAKETEYIVVKDAKKGWCYATKSSSGKLVASSVYRPNATKAPAGAITERSLPRGEGAGKNKRWTPRTEPLAGDRPMLIVRVRFPDDADIKNEEALSVDIREHLDNIWDGEMSVKQYYKDQSRGKLNLVPVSGGNKIFEIDITSQDNVYGDGEGKHPYYKINQRKVTDEYERYRNEIKFVQYVLDKVRTQYGITYEKYAETSGDKKIIDSDKLIVYLILAGFEEAEISVSRKDQGVPCVWAHQWSSDYTLGDEYQVLLSDDKGEKRNVSVALWAMNGEVGYDDAGMYNMPVIGTVCHELGHELCSLPDLYDISYYNDGLGVFSLMASGCNGASSGDVSGSRPVNLDAWSRYYLGWTVPEPASSAGGTLTLKTQSDANNPIKVGGPADYPYQYFLMEVRNPSGKWDAGLEHWEITKPGVLVTHVDEAVGSGSLKAGNDINQYLTDNLMESSDGKEVLNAHQGVMAICPWGDSRLERALVTTQESLWYAGNVSADNTVGISPKAAHDYLKGFFFKENAGKAEVETKISLYNFSGSNDTMTCSFDTEGAGGSSSGGCGAGFGALALLAAIPVVIRRRRS